MQNQICARFEKENFIYKTSCTILIRLVTVYFILLITNVLYVQSEHV